MFVRTVRLVPTIVLLMLLMLLGTLTLVTWSDVDPEPVRVSGSVDGLRSITWAATVSPAGRLAVRITYDFGDDTSRQLSVRLPDGARYFAVNDVPTEASTGVYATVTVSGTATVSYELPGAVTRYRDGALLQMVGVQDNSFDGDEALFACPRCYLEPSGYGDVPVFGSLAVAGAEQVGLSFVQLSSIRAEASPTEVRFAGIDRSGDAVAMLATLSSAVVSDLPVRDGTVAQALATTTRQIEDAGETVRRPSVPEHGSRPAAIVMTALLGAMVALVLLRTIWSVGSRSAQRAAGTPDAVGGMRAMRPDDLEPALAGAMVGNAVRGDRSVVAATVVELARRGVISFSGNDARRFTVTVPVGATGTTAFEQAVLDCLRGPTTAATTTVTTTDSADAADAAGLQSVVRVGPPLWGKDGPAAAKTLQRALVRESMRQKLTRISPTAVLLVPTTLTIGVLGIVGAVGGSVFAWLVTVVGGLIALAMATAGAVVLTAPGRAEQQQWTSYATWLCTEPGNAHLAHADPWDVDTVGEILAYATALGAAPQVVRLLSPRPRVQR